MNAATANVLAPDRDTVATLLGIVREHGTPSYAFDIRRMRAQVEALRTHLPPAVEILYSLKANASLGVCEVFHAAGLGADAASAGELATALEAGFPAERIFIAGPHKHGETVALLRERPEVLVSVDSPSELASLARAELGNRVLLRLRPDFGSSAVVVAGSESRFGFRLEDLETARALLSRASFEVAGFHVFAGSQVLAAHGVIEHLERALDLSLRAARVLGITPSVLNLGGGFGIPYAPGDAELDLRPIGDALARMVERATPARIILELGRYLVAQAGWYLTSVLGEQTHRGRDAVVVDGGTHQRADLCGLCLRTKARPPVALDAEPSPLVPTDVLGSLSLPADVLVESSPLPRLAPGNVLAFADAGAYGLWSSPVLFHGSPLPAEVAFDGASVELMRERQPARSVLDGQRHLRRGGAANGPTRS